MKNKMRYIILLGKEEVIAHIVENEKYGLVIIFIQNKLDISKGIEIYDVEKAKVINEQDLLDLVLFPFPNLEV